MATLRLDYPPPALFVAELTPREREIFLLLGDLSVANLTDLALGQHLGVTEYTVKKHLSRIYCKLGVRTRAAATLMSASWQNHCADLCLVCSTHRQ